MILEPRYWFNPSAESRNYLIPGSITVIMTVIGALLTSLVVAREWERGTMEALLASQVTRSELLLSKLLPYYALGIISLAICVLVAVWILLGYLDDRLGAAGTAPESTIIVRHWFNPHLDFVRHIIPSLVAIITTLSALVVTALSVAREREYGTFDQLLVSPLTPGMIMVGKTVPAVIVAAFQAGSILATGVVVYGIPFEGSLLLLYGCLVCYVLALAGFGLLISSVCSTQQQAFLDVFSFMMPAILLSGFPSPVENMPLWMQRIDWFNPLCHFIVIVKGVFVKGAGFELIWPSLWPLLVIAALTLSAANWIFRRRIG